MMILQFIVRRNYADAKLDYDDDDNDDDADDDFDSLISMLI